MFGIIARRSTKRYILFIFLAVRLLLVVVFSSGRHLLRNLPQSVFSFLWRYIYIAWTDIL